MVSAACLWGPDLALPVVLAGSEPCSLGKARNNIQPLHPLAAIAPLAPALTVARKIACRPGNLVAPRRTVAPDFEGRMVTTAVEVMN